MNELTRQAIPLATSAVTLWMFWLAGSKQVKTWTVGLGNQVLWVAFIVTFEAWGLIPLTAALTVVYARNLARWKRDENERDDAV